MIDRTKNVLTSGVLVFLILVVVFGAMVNFGLVGGSSGTIYIRADGSVDPPTMAIQCEGRIYTFTDNIYDGIVIQKSNITIDGNGYTLRGSRSGYGFDLRSIASVRIENVKISGFEGGIYLYNASHNIILQNDMTDNGYGDGIRLSCSSYNIILKNYMANNTGRGIRLSDYSTRNTIYGNILLDNGEGVTLEWSDNNTISGNNMTNKGICITLRWSLNNTISGNNIAKNYIGVAHRESSGNTLYHNNLINNTIQVYDPAFDEPEGWAPSINTWHNGYPSGGNWWSDYNGTDLYSGPYQNETGSDGIGDAPHIINIYNQDKYPSMNQCLDTASPITFNDYDGLWHSADFMVILAAVDDKSGVNDTYYRINDRINKTVSADGHPLITVEGANNTLEYWSVDNAGNEEIPHKILTSVKLDKTAPSGFILINNDDANTTTVNVSLNLWASDTTSGVSQTRFSNDETNWTAWETYASFKAWNLSLREGTKTVYVQYQDVAGFVSPTCNDSITLMDVNAPETTISLSGVLGNNNWFISDVTVAFFATDDISEVGKTEYSLDNATWTTYTTPFNITNEGNTTLYYQSIDKAGNIETVVTETIKIDKTNPLGSIHINNGDAYTTLTSVTLTLTANDSTSSVAEMRLSNDNTTYNDWQTYTSSKSWALQGVDGAKTVYVQFRDRAGLISTCSDMIILDTTAPTIGIPSREPDGDILPNQFVEVSADITDAISQVKNVVLLYTIDNGTTWTDLPMNHSSSANLYQTTIPPQPPGTWVKYKIVAFDYAENSATLDGMEPYCIYQVIPEFSATIILALFTLLPLMIKLAKRIQRTSPEPSFRF